MNVEILVPLYNAANYVLEQYKAIKKQKKVKNYSVKYLLTESTDNTEEILKENKLKYEVIKKKDFSHSLTREKAAMKSKADIVVFITQDVVIESDTWLYNLVNPIIKGEAEATYSRQITKFNNIEKYTRESNYPDKSRIKTKDDIPELGLKTFFSSDASAAIKTSVFKELKGYDGKDLPLSEDMYFSYKLIMAGYRLKYAADSVVYHSHNYKLKELYDRYKLTGKFFKENSYLDQYGTTDSGAKLAFYVLKRILQEGRILLLFRFPFDMAARLFGMKAGKR